MPVTPSPRNLAQDPKGSKRIITFRLNEPDYQALLQLAESASIGHATLSRRIVEHYIQDQMPALRKRK